MVLYDVGPWYEEDAVREIVGNLPTVSVAGVSRLQWTPGNPVLAAWRVSGTGLAGLEGAMLAPEDKGEPPMRVMGIREFAGEKREQEEARRRRQRPGKGAIRPQYAQVARQQPQQQQQYKTTYWPTTVAQGKGKGRGGKGAGNW